MAERRIETSIEINAPPKRVWTILTDFAEMATWNPFIRSISGGLTTGGKLSVRIAPPGKKGMQFTPTILAVRPERELRWLGRILLPGIFDGEHYFLLDSIGGECTRFTQGEKFSGLLVSAFAGMLSATEDGFKAMNSALKQQAEGAVP
jgi:hypothetical protein